MLGDNIKSIRNKRNLTQEDVIKMAKEIVKNSDKKAFAQAQLSRWEKNQSYPTDENINLLAEIYECDVSEIVEKKEQEKLSEEYKTGFEIGIQFTKEQLLVPMHILTDNMKETEERIKYLTEFLIKNQVQLIPECIPEMLSLYKKDSSDSKIFSMYYSFIIGLWNGGVANSDKNKKIKGTKNETI